jgi:hypothetical protein
MECREADRVLTDQDDTPFGGCIVKQKKGRALDTDNRMRS